MPVTEPAVWVMIPAAGRGRRMGEATPKQYLPLAGRTVIDHTLACFTAHPRITGIVVAIAADDAEWSQHVPQTDKPVHVVTGGAERCYSVQNALTFLADKVSADDWVLVHDAARPGLTTTALGRLIDACLLAGQGGLLALPVADTLKRAAVDPGSLLVAQW